IQEFLLADPPFSLRYKLLLQERSSFGHEERFYYAYDLPQKIDFLTRTVQYDWHYYASRNGSTACLCFARLSWRYYDDRLLDHIIGLLPQVRDPNVTDLRGRTLLSIAIQFYQIHRSVQLIRLLMDWKVDGLS